MLIFLLLLLLAILFIWIGSRQRRAINSWRKHLALDKHFAVFQALYANVDGFALSKRAREDKDALEYVYGEIEFESFIALLSLCKTNASTIFYDLGSGTGKAVIACALVFEVQKSCGIEIFPTLHNCAQTQQRRLKQFSHYQQKAERIEFILGDLLTSQFNDASLVFINATAFFGEYWLTISKHLEQLKPGSLVISTSKAILSNQFTTREVTAIQMNWGVVNAFIQEKCINGIVP
ncbi:hypothetical protein [Legionella hackeliae]|uniref:Histone-lysine N-methyltransferase, H3 lysine-79 specific n=2 Tax=Legionella hackeliae TaxID=449 RepID=A0A0A8UX86_LEGHA|nr:hypothetical protein [Legionella hackeliae]KTD12688.1 putative methyltransferase [Legionella hackeliae]CEK12106.1 putative methyltransferases [Legionella hackeliae]STX48893.1 putative methyltransferases [Legionella hackeliae]